MGPRNSLVLTDGHRDVQVTQRGKPEYESVKQAWRSLHRMLPQDALAANKKTSLNPNRKSEIGPNLFTHTNSDKRSSRSTLVRGHHLLKDAYL